MVYLNWYVGGESRKVILYLEKKEKRTNSPVRKCFL